MATLLLTLIYLSFISLGLPDSLLGAAWPVMGPQLQAPAWHAGGISFLITASTVCGAGRRMAHSTQERCRRKPVKSASAPSSPV